MNPTLVFTIQPQHPRSDEWGENGIARFTPLHKHTKFFLRAFINRNMSAWGHDTLLERAGLRLDSSDTIFSFNSLMLAAQCGNVDLVQHIIKLGNKSLLNLGDVHRRTALSHAITCDDQGKAFLISKLLIEGGIDINLADFFDTPPGDPVVLSTPLWRAAEDTNHLPLLQLLILNGGIIYRPLTLQGQRNVNFAIQQLFDKIKLTLIAEQDQGSHHHVLGRDVLKFVGYAILHAAKEGLEL